MFSSICQNNIHHFNQAKDTPLAKAPLNNLFPPFEINPLILQQIQNNNLTLFSHLKHPYKQLLRQLPTNEVPTIQDDLSENTFKGIKYIPEGKLCLNQDVTTPSTNPFSSTNYLSLLLSNWLIFARTIPSSSNTGNTSSKSWYAKLLEIINLKNYASFSF